MRRITALFSIALFVHAPAFADEWEWTLTPYLWAAGIDGQAGVGPVDADISMDFGDIVDVLRGAGMLRLEASNGKHGVFGDLLYMRLKEDNARDTIGGTCPVFGTRPFVGLSPAIPQQCAGHRMLPPESLPRRLHATGSR